MVAKFNKKQDIWEFETWGDVGRFVFSKIIADPMFIIIEMALIFALIKFVLGEI